MLLEKIGVSPQKEKQFNQKGIDSVEKLLRFYPRNYIDCTAETGLKDGEFCVFYVVVKAVTQHNGNTPTIKARCSEVRTGELVNVFWFRKDYLYPSLNYMTNFEVLVAGKVSYSAEYKNYSLVEPFLFTLDLEGGKRIYPVYSKINRMSTDYLSEKMDVALGNTVLMDNIWPDKVLEQCNLLDTPTAIRNIHSPKTMEDVERARDRFIFDDLLYFALNMEKAKRANSIGTQYNITSFETTKKVLDSLPYKLTDDQREIMRNLSTDAKHGRRINALVEGDVGTGKSIIAFLCMIGMADSGYQAALMAPTQVLAQQHYEELKRLVEPHGIKVAFFGGNAMKKAEKEKLYKGIQSGEIQLVVGTHALLNPNIVFKDLAMIIVDEEHKFGVVQREGIIDKASRGVHFISMSATPIPRSLAQILYGDGMKLCTIKTKPNGRKPVTTLVAHNQDSVFKFINKQVKLGRQIYIVCPMIDKNENMEGVVSVEELYEMYHKALSPLGITIASLTGRTSKEDLAQLISEYKAGKIDILLATTVIEVGVNVPNASTIIIHNAERFGLAGLHQLRGRVGRGQYQSYCVLFSAEEDNPRLNVMCSTTDGFKIAEEDLKLRGAGELIGLKQSGDDKYMSLMLSYPEIYEMAKKVANNLLNTGEHKAALVSYEENCRANIPEKGAKKTDAV